MKTGTAFVLSASILTMGYLLYVPVPPTLVNPWRARAMGLAMGSVETVASIVSRVTGKEQSLYLSQWTQPLQRTVHQNYPNIQVQETRLAGVEVRLYRRKEVSGLIPAVVYMHGGGWVLGNTYFYDGWNVRLALMTDMAVVAVNYRKAPAHPYPIPFEDCLHVTQHVLKHGKQIGVDSKQVFVAGDSAGGNLAAAVALRLSLEDPSVVPPLKAQVLLSPVLQAITFNNPSYRQSPPVALSQERMILFWTAYLGIPLNSTTMSAMLNDKHISTDLQKSRHGSYAGKRQSVEVKDEYDVTLAATLDKRVVDPFLAPLMADDELLGKAPPAFILACEFEHLRDEVIEYAQRLEASGVKTDFRLKKGQTHPLLPLLNIPSAVLDTQDYEDIVKEVVSYLVSKVKV